MIDRRTIAYHEAGHAAMYYFFGQWTDLDGITMIPEGKFAAAVHSRRWFGPNEVDEVHLEATQTTAKLARMSVARKMMRILAGPCAQNRVTTQSPDWLYDLMDDEGMIEESDATRIDTLAQAASECGIRVRYWTILRRTAAWTEEALQCPRMWAIVEALASRLQTVDYLSGDDAWGIMAMAYGRYDGTPAFNDPKWSRRFTVPRPSGLARAHVSV